MTNPAPCTPTLDVLLTDTLRLVTGARHVVACVETGVDVVEGNLSRIEVVRECTCLTARLTAVLSWLLAQKALAAGEYDSGVDPRCTRLFGIGDPRLDPATAVTADRSGTDALSVLLVESAGLFERVARLDRQLDARGRKEGP